MLGHSRYFLCVMGKGNTFNIMLGDICVCKLRKKSRRRDRSRQHYATRGGVREKDFRIIKILCLGVNVEVMLTLQP